MDFTLKLYHELLTTLLKGGYSFQTLKGFLEEPGKRVVILRHDVDLRPGYALVMARLEKDMEVTGTYYFRVLGESFDIEVIREIHNLGHEIGYHYETMDTAGSSTRRKREDDEDGHWDRVVDVAWEDFRVNLERLREVVPVQTVAMHGSPRSRYNNLDLWKKYNYRELGIKGEPYLDVDFSDVFYLTDTGRRWDGASVSVRDKVESGFYGPEYVFRSTYDIIADVENGSLPSRIMINVHPQRWTDKPVPWLRELVLQNLKNQVKRLFVKS